MFKIYIVLDFYSKISANVSWLGVSWGFVSQMYKLKTELASTKLTLKFA